MKIGIILHSQTGNTLLVGERLLERLQEKGHDVTLIRMKNLETTDKHQQPEDTKLDSYPEVQGYEVIIFGAWVQAFSLCPGFQIYLKQLRKIEATHVSCFVTQHFPYSWMGGMNALSHMKKLLKDLGVDIKLAGVINWTNKKREEQIAVLVKRFSQQFDV